jgi:outer membrane protein TolC
LCALQAADWEVATAVANRLPRLSIGLSHSTSGADPGLLGTNLITRFTSGLLAPIFDAGRLKAEQSRQQAEANEALAVLEQALRVAVTEVENCLDREVVLKDESILLDRQIMLAGGSVDKAKLRYLNGDQTYLAVLDAMRELQALERLKVIIELDLLINRAQLLKALGADWSRRHETN